MILKILNEIASIGSTKQKQAILEKNKDNELMAKCSLEDYLRRKHGDAFRQLIITKCVPEYFNDRLFNGIFGGMF